MDVAPFIKSDRTMLPLRYVGNAIGADVKWDDSTKTATFTKNGLSANLTIGSNIISLSDGRKIEMDSAPVIKNDRMFASLTNIAKVFNLTFGNTNDGIAQNIEWNPANNSISISN